MTVRPVKKTALGLILFLLAGFLLYYAFKLIEPSSLPQNVLISNITDHQVTISWTTQKPTKGSLLLSQNGKFPLLPVFTKVFKDDGEKNLGKMNFYSTHKVTVDSLEPNKAYQFRIYQGWKRKYEGKFTTGPVLKSINTPSPVYGRVLSEDKKPVAGALIYFSASNSALLSTITNNEGRWSVDLANLRSKDLKNSFKIASSAAEMIVVDNAKVRVKATATTKQDNPWPDIILK